MLRLKLNSVLKVKFVDTSVPEIDSKLLIKRAILCKCPACGQGKLYQSYLKQVVACDACGEKYGDIRADDGPAWLTMFIVGHIVAPLIVMAMMLTEIPDWQLMIGFVVLALGLCLAILPSAKAIFITFIWRTKCEGN
jgi:uncharacterized protein (DUF983 family)